MICRRRSAVLCRDSARSQNKRIRGCACVFVCPLMLMCFGVKTLEPRSTSAVAACCARITMEPSARASASKSTKSSCAQVKRRHDDSDSRRRCLFSCVCATSGALVPQPVFASTSFQTRCDDACMSDIFGKYKAPDIGAEFAEDDSRPRDNVAALYGTITPTGVRTILNLLDIDSSDVFTDLGSGIGNVVLQVGANTPVRKARGIEFLRGRHAEALRHLADFKRNYTFDSQARIEFVNGDMTKDDYSDSTIVFADSVAFYPTLMKDLQRRCESNARLKYLITYRPLEATSMKFLGAIPDVKMDFLRYGVKFNVYSNIPGAKLREAV
mmetsp:Transcript_40231/g.87994  ORF Transcript_40231/g.87994 Transcript_40231/m.87994 type:complete len:326 (-) Transcript_40231:37-1014(-)